MSAVAAETMHLLGEQLLPPCMEAGQPNARRSGGFIASPIASEVDCPECLKWIHA